MPLNEECGLLEWVNNTVALRAILTKLYEREKKKVFVSSKGTWTAISPAYGLSSLSPTQSTASWIMPELRVPQKPQESLSKRFYLSTFHIPLS